MGKKNISVVLVIVFIFLMLIGCSKDSKYDIGIESPIVMSHTDATLKDGSNVFVNIEMIRGRYFYDSLGGGLYGNNWEGQYQIRICKSENNGDTIFEEPIYVGNDKQMNFGETFSLVFDDYNNDGNLDFTLGQWGDSNGNYYDIFSIGEDGEVVKLEIDKELYIASHEFSIGLEKLTGSSFVYSFYDIGKGEYLERVFEWKEDKFVWVR